MLYCWWIGPDDRADPIRTRIGNLEVFRDLCHPRLDFLLGIENVQLTQCLWVLASPPNLIY